MLSSRVRSAGESRSMRLRSRSARSAWRRDTIDRPSAVRDNIEARPSHGSGLRSISPSRSSFATAHVSAGCLICSVLTRSLSRHGPTPDRGCSTDSAEKLSRSEAGSRMNTELKSSMEWRRTRRSMRTGLEFGCLLGTLSAESTAAGQDVRAGADAGFAQWVGAVAEAIAAGQRSGEISTGIEPGRLAGTLIDGFEGATLRAKATGQTGPVDDFMTITLDRLLS